VAEQSVGLAASLTGELCPFAGWGLSVHGSVNLCDGAVRNRAVVKLSQGVHNVDLSLVLKLVTFQSACLEDLVLDIVDLVFFSWEGANGHEKERNAKQCTRGVHC